VTPPADGLSVAVTGPTGDLGIAVVNALERSRRVKSIVGMARRPFDPAAQGWKKTEYRQGDVTDEASVRDFVKGADVVVHLAFAILPSGDREKTREINVEGSRRVFETAARAGAERIVYASSVAAFGFSDALPKWVDEETPADGSPEWYYSAQKAEVEGVLADVLARRRKTKAWVFRPPVIAGPRARTLIEEMPYIRVSERMPDPVRRLLELVPIVRPVLPDPGTEMQLIHEDDCAAAFAAGVLGKGTPGVYCVAGPGIITVSDIADELGWLAIPIPELAVEFTAELLERLPRKPEMAEWLQAVRKPVLMRTARAKTELGWKPKHNATRTLAEMVSAVREERISIF
jgi:nucleoside-diphosphate-sugar epimerase